MRYGLFKGKEHTQREVAGVLGISRSYVSRIEKKAIGKLREEFEKNPIKTHKKEKKYALLLLEVSGYTITKGQNLFLGRKR